MLWKHLTAATAKLIVLFNILAMIYGESISNVFIVTVILTIVSYVLGDLYVLNRTNNRTATAFDFALYFVGIWILGSVLFDRQTPLILSVLYSAVAITIGEWFFHRYVMPLLFRKEKA